ncbi:MAG: hypothetical protein QXJ62_03645 [Nitrososphaeria archaeon]
MPIKVEDAKKYKRWEENEIKIAKFLEAHKGYAYTSEEIREGIGFRVVYTPDEHGSYLTPQNIGVFILDVSHAVLFEMILEQMVKKGRISCTEVAGKKYYFIE